MKVKAVIGANYGDEGKGLATAYFASQSKKSLIVLTNGGAQRGHTVEGAGKRHVFHHFGSSLPGMLRDCFYPKQFCINPMIFSQEMQELKSWPFDDIRIGADLRALVTTPYDMMTNQILELSRGDKRHGSTGTGVWATMCRDKVLPIRFEDILNDTVKFKIDDVIDYCFNVLEDVEIPDAYFKLFKSRGMREHFLYDVRMMRMKAWPIERLLKNKDYDTVVFENGQGLLLNRDPENVHTTPSYTGMENINEICKETFGLSSIEEAEICYVTRSYMTRHGEGPFPTEVKNTNFTFDKTNVPNLWQGTIRYGTLDFDDLNRRVQVDFSKCILPNAKKSAMLTHAVRNANPGIDRLRYISFVPGEVENYI